MPVFPIIITIKTKELRYLT